MANQTADYAEELDVLRAAHAAVKASERYVRRHKKGAYCKRRGCYLCNSVAGAAFSMRMLLSILQGELPISITETTKRK